jgi:hypothetical protein
MTDDCDHKKVSLEERIKDGKKLIVLNATVYKTGGDASLFSKADFNLVASQGFLDATNNGLIKGMTPHEENQT